MSRLSLRTRKDLLVLPDIETPEDRSHERKRLRRNQVLNIIRLNGPITHPEVARRAGLNLRTVKGHIQELLEGGLVFEDEQKEKTMGRPAPLDRIRPDGFCFLGISFLSQQVSFSLIGLDCSVIHKATLSLDPSATSSSRLELAREFLLRSLEEYSDSIPPLAGVILATPDYEFADNNFFGLVFPKAGTWQAALFRMLTAEFQVPVLMENQGRLDAIGSLWFGAGREFKSFAYIGVGDHPRITFIDDTHLHYGYLGQAGDFSAMTGSAAPNLGQVLSSHGLLEEANAAGLRVSTIQELGAHAREQGGKAREILLAAARRLAPITAITAALYGPEAIIVGGAIGGLADIMEEPWRDASRALLPEKIAFRLEMTFCPLASHSPETSPAAFGFHHLFNSQKEGLQELL